MASFCPDCRRRITGGTRCSCVSAPEHASAAPIPAPPPGDGTAKLVARRNARATALVAGVVVVVTGLVVAIALGSKNSGSATASGSGYSSQQGFGVRSAPATRSWPATTGLPTGTTPTSVTGDALTQLKQYAAADRAEVSSELQDHWVAQLSSKKVGGVADGVTYDASMVLRDHLALRARYSPVNLVWSGDWGSFKYPDYWVTVFAQPFDTADAANAWCDQEGLDKDSCYAKRIRATGPVEGNTKVR